MPGKPGHAQIRAELERLVSPHCPGIEINVGHSPRWDRICLTFRWAGFSDLLLEERFRKVARLIPPEYFEAVCRSAVWLELAPGESIDAFLAQPRSEDIDPRIPEIWRLLKEQHFFATLEDELVRILPAQCPDDLSISKRVLRSKGVASEHVAAACLAFIRHEAYTDWEVLGKVRPLADARPARRKDKKS